MVAQVIQNNKEYVLHDNRVAKQFTALWFETSGELSAGGRYPVTFFKVDDEEFVLKHYARGGLLAKFITDKYLYTAQARVRAFAEWHLLSHLYQNHLPVPLPVAARYRRCGLFYTADLITRSCRPARPLPDLIKDQGLPSEAWRIIGATIRKFHDFGINHPDLNANNILFDVRDNRVILLDFDKAYQGKLSKQSQLSNLYRLRRSLNKLSANHPAMNLTAEQFSTLCMGWKHGGE